MQGILIGNLTWGSPVRGLSLLQKGTSELGLLRRRGRWCNPSSPPHQEGEAGNRRRIPRARVCCDPWRSGFLWHCIKLDVGYPGGRGAQHQGSDPGGSSIAPRGSDLGRAGKGQSANPAEGMAEYTWRTGHGNDDVMGPSPKIPVGQPWVVPHGPRHHLQVLGRAELVVGPTVSKGGGDPAEPQTTLSCPSRPRKCSDQNQAEVCLVWNVPGHQGVRPVLPSLWTKQNA